ncbi:hypothetical protein VR43_25235 [Streptomyces sp. NRRL S-104]|nr:hypothetical protein VR43_25235 [Streptomyces sp. NRRL S-104]
MTGRLAAAGQRLARGTGLLLESPSRWFEVPTMGGLVVRLAVPTGALAFAGRVLERAPHLIYVVPVGWLWAAWVMSDSSATPPPLPGTPSGDVFADELVEGATVFRSPEGVVFIVHPRRVPPMSASTRPESTTKRAASWPPPDR